MKVIHHLGGEVMKVFKEKSRTRGASLRLTEPRSGPLCSGGAPASGTVALVLRSTPSRKAATDISPQLKLRAIIGCVFGTNALPEPG